MYIKEPLTWVGVIRTFRNKNFSFNTFHEEYLVRTLRVWNLNQHSVIMTLKNKNVKLQERCVTFFHDFGRYVAIFTILTRRLRKCTIKLKERDPWILQKGNYDVSAALSKVLIAVLRGWLGHRPGASHVEAGAPSAWSAHRLHSARSDQRPQVPAHESHHSPWHQRLQHSAHGRWTRQAHGFRLLQVITDANLSISKLIVHSLAYCFVFN